ncbi:MAG: hypothetical protein ACE37E_16815 [Hyphomicrobiales bacterium]
MINLSTTINRLHALLAFVTLSTAAWMLSATVAQTVGDGSHPTIGEVTEITRGLEQP